MSFRTLACSILAAFSITGAVTAQTNFALNEKTIDGVYSSGTITVTVESNDAKVDALAKRAFAAHGSYQLATNARVKISLTKDSETSVLLVCDMLATGRRATQKISGANWSDATLRACDAAVTITGESLKLRPFFAGQLAFVSDRTGKKEIYVSDLFLGSVRGVTSLNSISITPHWIRGGGEVLFTTYHNNNFTDVYAVNATTGKLRGVLVGIRGTTTGAVSNPATGALAFSSSSRGNMDIYTTNADGRGAKAIVKTPDVDTDPAWSANGAQLAFVSGPNGRPGIYTVPAAGGAPSRIPTPDYNYATEPSWNPVDTNKIAFTFQKNRLFHIGIVDTVTRQVKEVKPAGSGANFMHATWCADGRHLVATKAVGGATSLVLIDSETGKTTPLSGSQMANCSEPDYCFSK